MIAIEEYYTQLPGGRCYQKGGARLEKAVYNCIPDTIKKHIKQNLRPKKDNGDVIVEYDMLYVNNNHMVSIEIKGLNDKTSNCPDRQHKLLNQAIRQKQFLDETFTHKNVNIGVIFCFVTGKNSLPLNQEFIANLENNGIIICIGETPNDVVKNAILTLKNNNLTNSTNKIQSSDKEQSLINKCGLSFVDIIKKNYIYIY